MDEPTASKRYAEIFVSTNTQILWHHCGPWVSGCDLWCGADGLASAETPQPAAASTNHKAQDNAELSVRFETNYNNVSLLALILKKQLFGVHCKSLESNSKCIPSIEQ